MVLSTETQNIMYIYEIILIGFLICLYLLKQPYPKNCVTQISVFEDAARCSKITNLIKSMEISYVGGTEH